MNPVPVVIYHANCADGTASAWVAALHFKPEMPEFIPLNYGDDISRLHERIADRDVVVLDFSFKRDLMIEFNKIAKSFLVLDHHKTAMQDCAGLDFCTFDLSKSGAMLAWEHFNPVFPPPLLVKYVEDRDLWQWKLPFSHEINSVIQASPHTLPAYAELHERLVNGQEAMIEEGRTIIKIKLAAVIHACKYPIMMHIGGYCVPVINNPNLISETCEMMAQDREFAAAFFLRQDGKWQFSLRSRPPKGIDVSAIAKSYGGGGHPQAAGFELPLDDLSKLLRNP